MKRIRTQRGAIARYSAIYRRELGNAVWDYPTLSGCYPVTALKLLICRRLHKLLGE